MNSPRLEQLLAFLKEDPHDTFTLYAIALEYEKINVDKAFEYYHQLLKDYPDYTGTYYTLAKLYEKTGKTEEAEKIYLTGMDVTRRLGKIKAFNELQAAYNMLKDEEF
jgi:tetratricopeptide (TPR) repeat protein